MAKKQGTPTSEFPMMSAQKEKRLRELHEEGYGPKEIAIRMRSNMQMVMLWHKFLSLEPHTVGGQAAIAKAWGVDPKPQAPKNYRYNTRDQIRTGEVIDNTMPERQTCALTVCSLF